MPSLHTILTLSLAASLTLSLTACSKGSTSTGAGGTGGEWNGPGGSSTGTGAGSSGSASSGSGGGQPTSGYCTKGCDTPADCCSEGIPDCPGPYPENWQCNAGVCDYPGCNTNVECGFIGPSAECHKVSGLGICFDPCTSDNDCVNFPGTTCKPFADDGAKWCTKPETGCASDSECGKLSCKNGECVCTSDDQCAGAGVCKGDYCGCDTNAQCTAQYADTCVK
jgi:hypothetical protein